MYEDMITQAQSSIERMVGPARQFQSLFVDSAEKAARFQLECTRAYAEMGLRNVREGLSVGGPSELQSYLGAQPELVKGVAEKFQQDIQTVVGMQQEFGQQVQKLFDENTQAAAPLAQSSKPARSTSTGTRKSA